MHAKELSFIWYCPSVYWRLYERFYGVWTNKIMKIILFCIFPTPATSAYPHFIAIRKTILTSQGGRKLALVLGKVYQVLKTLLIIHWEWRVFVEERF